MADLYHPQRFKEPDRSGKITVYYSTLNQIVQPIATAVMEVISLLEILVNGIKLLIWQMHSFHYTSDRRTEAICIHME